MDKRRTLLIVDDDVFFAQSVMDSLGVAPLDAVAARSVSEAIELLQAGTIDVALIDLRLPLTAANEERSDEYRSARAGFRSGRVLAEWIMRNQPGVPFLGYSGAPDHEMEQWFRRHGAGFFNRDQLTRKSFPDRVLGILDPTRPYRPKCFIVHGHDDGAKYALKNYLQNTLGFGNPLVLHELPSLGRSIFEKLEEETEDVELVFVLLTPDDRACPVNATNDEKRHARQNVVLELGYFLGRLGRKSGRVILLYKGPLELPSDIHGLVYVDVSHGIEAAGETLRRDLSDFVPAMGSRS
jgi:hypothetical protein